MQFIHQNIGALFFGAYEIFKMQPSEAPSSKTFKDADRGRRVEFRNSLCASARAEARSLSAAAKLKTNTLAECVSIQPSYEHVIYK
jgi:hypothetical protein